MMRLPDPSDPALWLDAAYRLLVSDTCDGCTECSAKCAGPIQVWREEYETLRQAAEALGLAWPPHEPASEFNVCPFLDAGGLCTVYSARPLVCRAFGLVPWLPCTLGKTSPMDVARALRLFADYASRPRKTLAQWHRHLNS